MVDERDHQRRRLDDMQLVRQYVTGHLSGIAVLDAAVKAAAQIVEGTTITVRLVETSGGDILVRVATADGEFFRTTERFSSDDGLGSHAIALDRFLVAADYTSSPYRSDTYVARGVTAAMAAPLRNDGAVVGVLTSSSTIPGRDFSAEEQRLMQLIAEQAALVFGDEGAAAVRSELVHEAEYGLSHDQLTGLANRAQVVARLQLIADEGGGSAVVFVDADRFKDINDAHGHAVGDEVLRRLARRVREAARATDLVARLSGDEFLVAARVHSEQEATLMAESIADVATFDIDVGQQSIEITASIGYAYRSNGDTPEDVVTNAELAMGRAKSLGTNRPARFDLAMRQARLDELTLDRDLRRAVADGELIVYFQPVVDLSTSEIRGAEALIRWDHPDRGVLVPGEFIDGAERLGVLADIDRAAMRGALRQLASWIADDRVGADFCMSVNVSAVQFRNPGLVDELAAELKRHGVPASRLWLEITETTMVDVESSMETMVGIVDLGAHLSVDDFGTGWSSLAYLKRFPVEALKIDQSFVADLGNYAEDRAIVEATIQLAGALGLGVIAEGVETVAQADDLQRMGCSLGQGYHFARPMAAESFARRWLDGSEQPAVPVPT